MKANRRARPPKKLNRTAYYKQWNTALGPVLRLVDRIADGVEENRNGHHKAVHNALQKATDAMIDWMQVKK